MASPSLVSKNFDLGFVSDIPRDQLPRGAAYRMVDWIPQNESPLRKRGGWTRASRDLNAVSVIGTQLQALAWVPFPQEGHLIVLSDNQKLYRVSQFDGASVAACGTLISSVELAGPVTHAPFYHGAVSPLVVIPESLERQSQLGSSQALRKYYDSGGGTWVTALLGGTPPRFTCGCSWGDYVIGANGYFSGTRYPNRAWWSDPGAPETWNPTQSYWDFPEEILAVVPRSKQLMFFGHTGVHMLVGDQPPPGGNFEMRGFFFRQGTFDVRSVVSYGDNVIWANSTGVFRSDGSTLVNLTEQGGISLFWQNLVAGFAVSPGIRWMATAGIYRGHYFISINGSNTATIATLVCDLRRMVWFQLSNCGSLMWANRPSGPATSIAGGFEELFSIGDPANIAAKHVNNISPLWSPTSTNASDADAVAVTPVLETPFYKMGLESFKRFRRAFVTYDMTSAAGAPVMNVGYVDSPEDTSYVSLTALPEKAAVGRSMSPVTIAKKLVGVGLKFTQSAASDDTRMHGIEIEGHPLEGSR